MLSSIKNNAKAPAVHKLRRTGGVGQISNIFAQVNINNNNNLFPICL